MTVSDIDTKQCRVIGPMGLVFEAHEANEIPNIGE